MRVIVQTFLAKLRADVRGTSAVEMGLICAMIVITIIAAMRGVAAETIGLWNTVETTSANAINGTN